MNKAIKTTIATSILALGLGAGVAQAAFINGSMSISDGGIALPALPSTSLVSQLNSVTQGTGATNSCNGDLSLAGVCLAATAASSTINLLAPAGTIYTYAGFTFTVASITNINRGAGLQATGAPNQLGDSLGFLIQGLVTGNGFQGTAFSGVWTGQGVCTGTFAPNTCVSNPSASWSVSISALGTPTNVPEPATLGLIGIALAGLGALRRRKA